MSTVSQESESSTAVVGGEAGHEIERSAGYTRPAPVESTIKPAAFVTLTVAILLLVALSLVAIWAGGNFDGGQPGLTSPANR
jgi:hypothetical protein